MSTTSAFTIRSAMGLQRRRLPARSAVRSRPLSRPNHELGTVVLLLGASNVLVNRVLPPRAYVVVNGSTALVLLRLARSWGLEPAALGLERKNVGRSAAVGLGGALAVASGFGVALGTPALRKAFEDRRIEDSSFGSMLWNALVRIPVGTVALEEVAFRGVLPALLGASRPSGGGRWPFQRPPSSRPRAGRLLAPRESGNSGRGVGRPQLQRDGDRWRWGPVLGASALFGLWHVLPSLELHRNAAVSTLFGGSAATVAVPAAAVLASGAAGVALCAYRHAGRGLLAPALVHTATNSGGVVAVWLARRSQAIRRSQLGRRSEVATTS